MGTKQIKVFESHAAADADDAEYYASLTPQQRLDLVLELSARFQKDSDAAVERRSRVYRVVELELR